MTPDKTQMENIREYLCSPRQKDNMTNFLGSIPVPGWWVVMVFNQAKLGQNYDENSRICTKQSICFRCLGKIGNLWCRPCGIIIHQPGTGIEPIFK